MAVFSACSKSTKVSSGQTLWRSSSRVTNSPGVFQQEGADLKRLALQGDLHPILVQFSGLQIRFEDSEADSLRRTLATVHVKYRLVR